jgi:hypothetical protein
MADDGIDLPEVEGLTQLAGAGLAARIDVLPR